MPVTREEVRRIAHLARLRLTDSEAERLTGQLNDILGHMNELAGLEAAAAPGVASGADWPAPLRQDELNADLLHVAPPALAPEWVDGFFTVPRLRAMHVPGDEGSGGGAEGELDGGVNAGSAER